MQFPGQGKTPTGVMFDALMDESIDQVLALSVLFGLEGMREAKIAALSTTREDLRVAAFCDALARFLGGPGAARMPLPIGCPATAKLAGDPAPMIAAVLAKQSAEGKPVYPRGIEKLNDTADAAALIRNGVSAQQPLNGVVILAGPATNLAQVLALPGVGDLIGKRVRLLVVAASDASLKRDLPAARKLFAEWPTPLVSVGKEIGDALPFPGASIDKDFGWAPNHPVADAYRAFKPMPYDTPARAAAAALYAVRPQSEFFKTSDAGTIRVLDDGRTQVMPSADGKHRSLMLDPADKDQVIQTLVQLASAKPPTPAGRGGRGNFDKGKAAPKEPPKQ